MYKNAVVICGHPESTMFFEYSVIRMQYPSILPSAMASIRVFKLSLRRLRIVHTVLFPMSNQCLFVPVANSNGKRHIFTLLRRKRWSSSELGFGHSQGFVFSETQYKIASHNCFSLSTVRCGHSMVEHNRP